MDFPMAEYAKYVVIVGCPPCHEMALLVKLHAGLVPINV